MRARTSLLLGVVLGGLAVAGATLAAAPPRSDPADLRDPPAAAPHTARAPQRFDHYCTTVVPGTFTETARKLGADGWEMVAMTSFETAKAAVQAYPFNVDVNVVMCFKRPLI